MPKKNKQDLKLENELKKLKLTAERGAYFPESDQSNLPLEVESEWLDYISAFEEAADKKESQKISELLGNPLLTPVASIPEGDLPDRLDELFTMLAEKNIHLDVLFDVPEKEIYRFISEELIHEEIQVINVPGLVTHFIYEEFHPNVHEDIKRYTKEFLEMLFGKSFEYMDMHMAKEVSLKGKRVPEMDLINFLEDRMDLIGEVQLIDLDIVDIQIGETSARSEAEVKFKDQGNIEHCEKAQVIFEHNYGYWYIANLTFQWLGI